MLISAKDIILQSIELYRKNTHLFIKYMLVLFIPTGIISILGSVLGTTGQMIYIYGLGTTLLLYILLIILGSIASLWVSMAFIKVIHSSHEKQAIPSIKTNLLSIKQLIIPALLASILSGLIILGGFILLIVPGIIFAVWFAFTIYSIAIENTKKPMKALKDSKKLVDGRWWDVFGRLVIPGLAFTLGAMIIQKIISWPLKFAIETAADSSFSLFFLLALGSILSLVVTLIFTPLTTAAPVILYNELKKNPLEMDAPEHPDQIETPAEPPTMQ